MLIDQLVWPLTAISISCFHNVKPRYQLHLTIAMQMLAFKHGRRRFRELEKNEIMQRR